MKTSAIDHLVCLKCRSRLDLAGDAKLQRQPPVEDCDEIMEGTLCCKCGESYPVRNGIPRFVDKALSSSTDIVTGSRFGSAWKSFPRMDERYRQQFFDWIYPVGPEFLKGKTVLEGGCGKGRHAKILSECGAQAIFSVDIGDAVDVAFRNVGRMPGVHIVQADICNLPFNADFDYVFSLGVLHHLKRPFDGLLSLLKRVRPGGSISIWVYGRENNLWLVNYINPLRENITSRMPPLLLMPVAAVLAAILFIASKLIVAPWHYLSQRFKWFPRLFYEDYLHYIARHDFNELHHIVYDHLVTPVAHYIRGDLIRIWFRKAGFPNPVLRWHNKNSWMSYYSSDADLMVKMRQIVEAQHD